MNTKRIRILERKIEKLKEELATLGDLRPGSLSEQYNVCGKKGCRCKETPPRRHGPYYQLSFKRKGKSSTRFVKVENVATVQDQIKNYKLLKDITAVLNGTGFSFCLPFHNDLPA